MRLLRVHPSALMYSEIFLGPARISPDYLANTPETIEIRATTKKSARAASSSPAGIASTRRTRRRT
jgi:hypothetical protein